MLKTVQWVISAATISLLFAVGAQAKIYRWVDDNGQVHYTQTPPQGRDSEDVSSGYRTNAPSAQESSEEAKPKSDIDQEIERLNKLKVERAEIQKKNCDIAKQNLTAYENASSSTLVDTNGKKITLSEEEQQNRIEKGRADVKKYCEEQ